MAENPVAKFRRVFADRLHSGKYEPIDVVQAVQGLSTSAQLVDSLDVYCTLFDPTKPPKSRNSYELGRTTGVNLFGRALELSSPQNGLAEFVITLEDPKAPPPRDSRLAKHVAVYRTRYAALDQKDRTSLQQRATKLVTDRANEAAKQRYLVDDLAKAFQNTQGHAPGPGELDWFDPGPQTSRKEFERLATACEVAWLPKQKGVAGVWVMDQFVPTPGAKAQTQSSAMAATQNVHAAFAAFANFVENEIKQPLDLFRLLAWASEPANPSLQLRRQTAPKLPVPSQAWSGVWQELYQDIAVRGVWMAVNRWNVERVIQPKQRGDGTTHGYVGKDLDHVLMPLKAHGRELLERRLADYFKGAKAFADAQDGRRRAKVWGDVKGLEIIDELEAESNLKDSVKEFEADTKAVLGRKLRIVSDIAVYQGKYSLYQTVEETFTIVWIPKNSGMRVAYVEVLAIPGVIFRAWGDRVGLEELIKDKVYQDLATNAMALAQFLLFYLQVVGYVVDIITVGATSGVRTIILRFIEERIKDKIVSEGLELAGIDNPWVQTLAGMATGLVPSAIHAPKIGAVKGLEELEHDAQTAIKGVKYKPKAGVGEVPVPKLKAGAAKAPEVAAPKVPAPTVGPRVDMVGDSAFVIEQSAASDLAAHTTQAMKGAPTVPGPFDRLKDYVVDKVERATDTVAESVAAPAVAHAEAGAGHAGGMLATRLPTKAVSPGVGGAGSRGTTRASAAAARASARLQKSSDYKLLLEYENEIMASWEKQESQRARNAIVNELERSAGNIAAEKEAIGKLRGWLNKKKGEAGEFLLEADLRSHFDVEDVVMVPVRKNKVPVLDVVVKLKKNSKLNGGKRFAFGEGKGGLNTQLGEVTPKRYSFKKGQLAFDVQPRRAAIRQSSGEWYYQKFAEVYMMGQEIGGAEGFRMQRLANELFEAARKGEIAAMVGKSNVSMDRKFFDSTAEVVAFFTSQKWDMSKGFPVPR